MSEFKEQLIELFENVSGCSIDEFSEEQLPYLADYIIGQQEADNMCIDKLKKENQRLTAIATKHATRADELYEVLECVCSYLSEDGLITTGLAKEIVNAQMVLYKSRIEAEGD